MKPFHFSRHGLTGWELRRERFFEILPGFTSWSILAGMIGLSFFQPVIAAVIIILFDFYWLLRLFYLTLFLMIAYLRLSLEEKTDWLERVRKIDALKQGAEVEKASPRGWQARVSDLVFRGEWKKLKASGALPPLSKDIYHLVIVPIYKELREVVEPGVASYAEGRFPAKQILIVLAVEERASEQVKAGARAIQEKYKEVFFDFLISIHPDGVPGEARVKAPTQLVPRVYRTNI